MKNIRFCRDDEHKAVLAIVNDAADFTAALFHTIDGMSRTCPWRGC